MDYILALNKTFLFKPGQGTAYSSDGYLLLGMVLSAISGAKLWSEFDQLAALGPIYPPLNQTIFMRNGPCSQYPHVVHQYTLRPKPKPEGEEDSVRRMGNSSWLNLSEADFVDLFSASCLNGWTMGNIAAAVQDAARFFYLLGNAQLTSPTTLTQMKNWHNITQGFGAGSLQYGLGLIHQFRQSTVDVTGAAVNWTQHWGHDGVDWGSKSTLNGYYPNLDAAMALAQNSESAMNFSGTNNYRESVTGHTQMHCRLENAVFQFLHPREPALKCI
jgi:CubicO group peptidase (beta-lactamase class C family)